MRLEFHRQLADDISQIMGYYEGVAEARLANEFYSELRVFFQKAADSPEAYEIVAHDLRRESREISLSFFVSYRRRSSPHSDCPPSPEATVAGSSPAMNARTS